MSTELPAILRGPEWRHVATPRFVRSDGAAIYRTTLGSWALHIPPGRPHVTDRGRTWRTLDAAASFLTNRYPLQPEKKNGN